jgi:branched-chain amino acid transport system substrate-binding protein
MTKAFLAVAVAVALLIAIPGAHARSSAAPGVSASRVLIGGTGPLSGPEVAYAGVVLGAQAYFRYVNDNGGVHGRKIEYRYLDDGYDPSRTIQATRRLVQQDRVFAMFNMVGTEQNLAVRAFLNAAKVPQLFGGTGSRKIGREHARYRWTMGYLPSFFAEGRLYGRHLVNARRRAKVAVLHEASDYGRELLAGFRAGIGRRATIVGTQTYEVTDTDLTSQITQLRRSGANVLMLFSLPKQTIGGFLAAARLGWRPPTYVSSVSVDPAVMKIVQASAGRRTGENAITVAWMKDASNPAIANDPAIRLYKRIMRRYAPERNVNEVVHMYGMSVAYSFVEALKKAGTNPTRESLLRAATHLNHQVPFMVKGVKIQTSPRDYFPISQVRFLRYQRGYWRQFGGLVSARD